MPKLELKEIYDFIHILQIVRSNMTWLVELDVSEVLLFHTNPRNYENQNHSTTEARIQRNEIIE